ncbi:MAG: phosphatase domain-containing protein [Pseudobdellovibrio sp.]
MDIFLRLALSFLIFVLSSTLFASLASAGLAQRPILIISDIDDTIKVSGVLTPLVLARALDHNTPFAGMASLYQLIVNQNPSLTKVFYLSNAPKEVLGLEPMRESHQALLETNKFPQGELILRDSLLDEGFKNRTISNLVRQYNPKFVFFFGDNGEKDVFTYEKASAELKALNIGSLTYIHQVYSSVEGSFYSFKGQALRPSQVGYATAVEVGIDLYTKKLLSEQSLDWMLNHTVRYITSESILKIDFNSPVAFPMFMNCSDFKWNKNWTIDAETLDYKLFVESKCR